MAERSGTGNVALGARTLTLGDASDQTFSGVINDTGGIVKQGTGAAALTAARTFTGDATLNAGTLALSGAGALAPSAALTLANAGSETFGACTPLHNACG